MLKSKIICICFKVSQEAACYKRIARDWGWCLDSARPVKCAHICTSHWLRGWGTGKFKRAKGRVFMSRMHACTHTHREIERERESLIFLIFHCLLQIIYTSVILYVRYLMSNQIFLPSFCCICRKVHIRFQLICIWLWEKQSAR